MLVWTAATLSAIAVALTAQFIVFAVVLRAVRNRPLATHATERLRSPTQVLVAALVVGSEGMLGVVVEITQHRATR